MEDEQYLDILADHVESFSCLKCESRISVADREPFSPVACPQCGATVPVPLQFGSFLLLRLLGMGGMGAVYEALDQSLDRHVAIKVLRREYGEEAKFLQGFLQEAQAAAALNHPNVAQIHSFGQERGQPYIVMELVPGGRLEDIVEAETVLEEAKVMDIAIHVAEGMEAAHKAGLIHGDIKPANILFDKHGTAKIVDFGLASFVRKKRESPGGTWGTPYYIAPEKVLQKPADHRADIYSLGGSIFHVLTGAAPFEAETAREVVQARLERPPPDPRDIRPGVTDETASVLTRMLALKPGRRYPTYASLLADLRAGKRAANAATAEAEEQRLQAEAAAAAAREPVSPVRLAIRIALVAGLLGAGVWWWQGRPEPTVEREIAYHVLRDGKPVPVYADEIGSSGAPTQRPAEPSQTKALWSPADSAVVAAMADFEDGRTFLAQQKLTGRLDATAPGDPLSNRIVLAQFLIEWSSGRTDQAHDYLDAIRAGEPDPAALAYVQFLEGEIDDGGLSSLAQHWTGPEAALVPLILGIRAVETDDLVSARDAFENYVVSTPDTTSWVHAFRPTALQWIADIQTLQASSGQWSGRTSRQATRILEDLRDDMSGVFKARVDGELARIEAERDALSAKLKATKQEKIDREARDRDRIERVVESNRDRIRTKAFPAALAALGEVQPELESDKGKATMKVERAKVARLVELSDFLARSISASPPRKPVRELGGRITRADSEGVHIARNGGDDLHPWTEVSERMYLAFFTFYIRDPELGDPERADLLCAMGLWQYLDGDLAEAREWTSQAVGIEPSLAADARKLMPELDLPGGNS